MREASKFRDRATREGWFEKYLVGKGIDIGCGSDPVLPTVDVWDLPQGDAQMMATISDGVYDFVFSSHCIEHMNDPIEALKNWWRILKPKGYLIVIGPERDLYEHGIWPSVFNPDHKATFTINTDHNWSPRNYQITDLVQLLPNRKVISLRTIDTGYDYAKLDKFEDQSLGEAEVAFEIIMQKDPIKLKRHIYDYQSKTLYRIDP